MKSEWQLAGVISEFRGVWGLPRTCESEVRGAAGLGVVGREAVATSLLVWYPLPTVPW